jgi:1-acyl-sn-glycerol-3-phosphate acyltransferase
MLLNNILELPGKVFRCIGFMTFLFILISGSNLYFRCNKLINYNKTNLEIIKLNRDFYSNFTSFLLKRLFWIEIEIQNEKELENMDLKKQNLIIISNHISYLDTFILTSLFPKIKNCNKCDFIGMESIFDWFIAGYVFKNLGMIPVKFEISKFKNINKYSKKSVILANTKCINTLKNGNSLCMFPEGQCNYNPNKLNQIRGGAFKYHQESNTPIKIFAMKNNNLIWPNKGYPCGKSKIYIKVFDGIYKFKNIEEYRKTIKDKIEGWMKQN